MNFIRCLFGLPEKLDREQEHIKNIMSHRLVKCDLFVSTSVDRLNYQIVANGLDSSQFKYSYQGDFFMADNSDFIRENWNK